VSFCIRLKQSAVKALQKMPKEDRLRMITAIDLLKDNPAATVKENDLRGLKKLAGLAGSQFKMGVLLYDGSETMPLGGRDLGCAVVELMGHMMSETRH
jgi:hypothetical protein